MKVEGGSSSVSRLSARSTRQGSDCRFSWRSSAPFPATLWFSCPVSRAAWRQQSSSLARSRFSVPERFSWAWTRQRRRLVHELAAGGVEWLRVAGEQDSSRDRTDCTGRTGRTGLWDDYLDGATTSVVSLDDLSLLGTPRRSKRFRRGRDGKLLSWMRSRERSRSARLLGSRDTSFS